MTDNTTATATTTTTTTAAPAATTNSASATSRSGFRTKAVYRLYCRHCRYKVCTRGMRAMLLANNSTELFSTDVPPVWVQLVGEDYTTRSCSCMIRNIACNVCGNEIGYHITQACGSCLKSVHNGHFWMFLTEGVVAEERLDRNLSSLLLWDTLLTDKTIIRNPLGDWNTVPPCR